MNTIYNENERMNELFKDSYYHHNGPALVSRLPYDIMHELTIMVERCRAIKDHNLGFLRMHRNVGKNSYQVALPSFLFQQSFFYPYLIAMGEFYTKSIPTNRQVEIKRYLGHYDEYDTWVNFTYKGDINPMHSHSGSLSGVVYFKNDGQPTLFEHHKPFVGEPGMMLMFPSDYVHGVEEKNTDEERITISFNLDIRK
jgi:hypothetical protein